jgi:hypothetical protein
MGIGERYPETHEAFLQHSHEIGPARPTALLQYGPGDHDAR